MTIRLKRLLIGMVMLLTSSAICAEVTRASDWLGRVILTADGELLGRIEDLGLSGDAASIEYLVISVGSFMIEDNLIAVAPGVLEPSSDGEYLVISKDTLSKAPRFSEGAWPDEAQILSPAKPARASLPDQQPESVSNRSAEIIGSNKKATWAGDATNPTIELTRPKANLPSARVEPKKFSGGIQDREKRSGAFQRFDIDADGYLSRVEVGAYLKPGYDFASYDLDTNGGLDAFEFRVLQEDAR